MSTLTPCGPGELGPVCDGPALVDAVTAVASPSPSVAAVVVQAGEPSWYYVWDVAGTWLGAIGTLIASGIALWLGLRAVRDQRALQDERERAQAERVIFMRSPTGRLTNLLLRNESDRSIRTLRVSAVGDTAAADDPTAPRTADLVKPGNELQFYVPGSDDPLNLAVVEFDDSNGRTWVRTAEGDLYRTHRILGWGSSVRAIPDLQGTERVVTRLYVNVRPYHARRGYKMVQLRINPLSLKFRPKPRPLPAPPPGSDANAKGIDPTTDPRSSSGAERP